MLGDDAEDEIHSVTTGECRHCGLPCPASVCFCCYGCELVHGLSSRAEAEGSGTRARLALALFFAMNLMALSLFQYSGEIYRVAPDGLGAGLLKLFAWASALFATPVVVLLGVPMARRALALLRERQAGTELLVSIAALVAYAYSWVELLGGEGAVYFDVACMTLVLVSAGRFLEASARAATTRTVIGGLRPGAQACERRNPEGTWQSVSPHQLAIGDIVRVAVGAVVPVDGRVVSGDAAVDNAVVSGESAPLSVAPGDEVVAGAVVSGAPIEVEALSDVRGSTLAMLEQLLRRARQQRAPVQRVADRMAAALAPTMLLIAAASLVYWASVGETASGVLAAVAVLIVACPCSFAIATPLAMWTALARAARLGVFFAGAPALERLASVRAAAFDKTGTLTTREREIGEACFFGDRREILGWIAAIEAAVRHPLADGLVAMAKAEGVGVGVAEDVRVLDGLGVRGRVAGKTVFVGSTRLLAERVGTDAAQALAEGSVVAFDASGRVLASMTVAEKLRDEAAVAVATLEDLGLRVSMITGDGDGAANSVADQLGLDVRASQSPGDKLRAVAELEQRYGPTMMVGDGSNDGPALSRVALGVALGSGTDLAKAVAALNLRSSDLGLLPWSLSLARSTMMVVRQNLVWSVAYNSVCVVLAASGHLTPAIAALAMLGSSITVLLNSLRISRIADPGPRLPSRDRRAARLSLQPLEAVR